MQRDPELLRLVVVGSVDDGKSTLIGRLLYEANTLCEDQISHVRRATKQVGEELDFSLFTDGLKAEREQGITIDVAYRSFSTATRRFIVADTPGHVQYTRNMATGASTADVAVILIDARLRVLPQTRRHAHLASLLGIRHLVVAVNKMDLVGFDRVVFDGIRGELDAFLKPLGFDSVRYFPISAKAGDNVVASSAATPWHDGGTLFAYLHEVPAGGDFTADGPLRFPVQMVLRPHLEYRGFAGQLSSGEVSVGDEVVVLPSGKRTTIAGIDTFDGPLQRAFAPMSVALRLSDEVDVSRGDVIARPDSAPAVIRQLESTLVWLNERPLDTARQYLVKHTSRTVPARLNRIEAKLDLETLEWRSSDSLNLNDVGRVSWQCLRPLCADPYESVRPTGAFIVIDAVTNDTVAAGMIQSVGAVETRGPASRIDVAQRQARLGQRGGVVVVEASLEAAYALEAELFSKGLAVTVVEGDARAAAACAAGGLLCLCVGDARVRADLELLGVSLISAAEAAASQITLH